MNKSLGTPLRGGQRISHLHLLYQLMDIWFWQMKHILSEWWQKYINTSRSLSIFHIYYIINDNVGWNYYIYDSIKAFNWWCFHYYFVLTNLCLTSIQCLRFAYGLVTWCDTRFNYNVNSNLRTHYSWLLDSELLKFKCSIRSN